MRIRPEGKKSPPAPGNFQELEPAIFSLGERGNFFAFNIDLETAEMSHEEKKDPVLRGGFRGGEREGFPPHRRHKEKNAQGRAVA